MPQITLEKSANPDNISYLVGSEAKNPLPTKTIGIVSCHNCKGSLNVYSRCFDCKQAIQVICYKCQWESNIRDHIGCHKNVPIVSNRISNFQKRDHDTFDEIKYTIDDLYHNPIYTIAPIFNLIH